MEANSFPLSAATANNSADVFLNARQMCSQVAFPNPDHDPSALLKRSRRGPITANVAADLPKPVFSVVSMPKPRRACGPSSAVPEVAIAKHDHARLVKNYVRLSRQLVRVNPEWESKLQKRMAQSQFRTRSLTPDGPLRVRSLRRCRREPFEPWSSLFHLRAGDKIC